MCGDLCALSSVEEQIVCAMVEAENEAATLRAVKGPDGTMSTEVVRSGLGFMPLLSASVLTFFAFVGFEDMLNISEEVKDPQRTMPWGIVGAVAGATTHG